jgi:hypothetical protein
MAGSVNGGAVSNLLKTLGFVRTLSFGVTGYAKRATGVVGAW